MKNLIITFCMLLAFASTAQAADPEGAVTGSFVSYLSIANDGVSTTQEMVGVPILGYQSSMQVDDLKISGNVRFQFEGGAYDILDQNIIIESGWFKILAGHEEFMDHSLGVDYLVWIDNSLGVGDVGLEGGDDVFEFAMTNLGVSARIGINNHIYDPLLPLELTTTTFASATYMLEEETFAFMLTATTATDKLDPIVSPSLVGGDFDGRVQTSMATAVQVSLGESLRLSLNAQVADTQLGTPLSLPVNDTIITFVWDQDIGESQGFTLDLGMQLTGDGTPNPTEVSQIDFTYVYNIELVSIFLAYSATASKDADVAPVPTTSEAGLGLFYEY